MTVEQVDILTRRLQAKVYLETGVVLTGVGVYSYNTKDNEAARIRNKVQTIVLSHSWALQLHGFYVNIPDKYMRFDTVLSFDVDHAEAVHKLTEEISEKFEGYKIEITPDVDLSDI